MAPVRKKCTGQEPQVRAGQSGLPCAMGLRLIRDLPGDHAWLPPSPARRSKRLHELSACIGAPEPHDFTVRRPAIRLRFAAHLTRQRPSHCRSNVRDDRDTPLVSRKFGRMCERAVAHQPPVAGTEPATPQRRQSLVKSEGQLRWSSSTRTVARASSPNRARKGVDDDTKRSRCRRH
jgi:hypothetical protein